VMYETRSGDESKEICERVAPRLQHANAAVVLSAAKVILKFVDRTDGEDFQRVMFRKMAPPLVTLLSSEPEIQYVALRNINLIIQKWPSILRHEIKVFFCKYNDPIYVKMEKVETMIQLADESNIGQVLLEFNEYASEVDVEFVRRSVRAIGRCAIKLERAAQKCVDVLIELIKTRVNYVVQEAIVVIRDIFRRYPNKYESIISVLCENLDSLDEAEAKGAMIWIIGEYAPRIENAGDLLEQFVDGFVDEQPNVQLQLLTSVVKLFLHRPDETQEMVHRVLQLCTEESDNPDLRDRAFVYWRLLSTDPDAAKGVVLAEKPVISDTSVMLDKSLLSRLLGNVSMLASVYHKPPEEFVPDFHVFHHGDDESDSDEDEVEDSAYPDEVSSGKEPVGAAARDGGSSSGGGDMLDLGGEPSTPVKTSHAEAENVSSGSGGIDIDDLLGFSSPTAVGSIASNTPMDLWLSGDRGKGLEIRGAFVHKGIEFEFRNTSDVSMLGFAIQFNKNMYGVLPAQPLRVPEPLMSGQRVSVTLPITVLASMVVPTAKTTNLQVAVKNNFGIQMFQCPFSPSCVLEDDGKVEGAEFIGLWGSLSDDFQAMGPLSLAADTDADYIKAVCEEKRLAFITERKIEGKRALFFSGKAPVDGDVLLVQLSLCDKDGSRMIARCHTIGYAKGMCDELKRYFVEK
jgi:AP-1 complex subunit beta-1